MIRTRLYWRFKQPFLAVKIKAAIQNFGKEKHYETSIYGDWFDFSLFDPGGRANHVHLPKPSFYRAGGSGNGHGTSACRDGHRHQATAALDQGHAARRSTAAEARGPWLAY